MLTDEQKDLFHGRNFAHFATVMSDGSPQVSAVWVEMEGDLIVVNTREGRIKTANVRRDPRVAISVVDHDDPYRRVAVRGEVVEITQEGGAEGIDRLSEKYRGVTPYADHDPAHPRVVIKIRPTHASA